MMDEVQKEADVAAENALNALADHIIHTLKKEPLDTKFGEAKKLCESAKALIKARGRRAADFYEDERGQDEMAAIRGYIDNHENRLVRARYNNTAGIITNGINTAGIITNGINTTGNIFTLNTMTTGTNAATYQITVPGVVYQVG